MSLGLLAGDLKRKEMLSGRLADIHAHLFISTAILKFYEAGQKTEAEQLHAKLALQKAFLNIQEAFWGLFENFPAKLPATFVKWICFPLGRVISKPDDELKQQVAELMMQEHPFREQLKHHVFYSTKADDVTGRLEHTFQILRTLEPLWDKFKKAESKGKFTGLTFEENIAQAIKEGFITESEAQQLLQYNAIRFDSMLTDVFDKDLNKDLPLSNPHQI